MLKMATTTKAKIGTNFVIVTIVLIAAADSIPRVTKSVNAHDTSDAKTIAGTLLPDCNAGKKYPSADINIVANATLPSHADSQYPQPEMNPAKSPKPARA